MAGSHLLSKQKSNLERRLRIAGVYAPKGISFEMHRLTHAGVRDGGQERHSPMYGWTHKSSGKRDENGMLMNLKLDEWQ